MIKVSLTNKPFNKVNHKKRISIRKALKVLLLLLVPLSLLALVIIGIFWNSYLKREEVENNVQGEVEAEICTDILNPDCWTEALRPQLKQQDNKTNALIVGIDTRSSGSGSGLLNTDTLMLVTINHQTKHTRLLSFPRDLYAPYGCPGSKTLPYKIKINAIYAFGQINCKEKDGMTTIKQTIEKITGEKIQYTALIRLEGVIKGIDSIGGIDLDVPEDYTDVYPYIELSEPKKNECKHAKTAPGYRYCIFTFKKGLTHLSGEEALIYARMREWHTDFYRARHQQQVLDAIKSKILSDENPMLEKAENLFSLYIEISKYLEVDIDLETILGVLALVNEVDFNPIKVVLDPGFAGGGLISSSGGGNYAFKDYSFKQIQDRLKLIDEYSELYKDFFENSDARIFTVNYTGNKFTTENPISFLLANKLWWIKSGNQIISETRSVQENTANVIIVDFSNGEKTATIDWLANKFQTLGWRVEIVKNQDIENTSPSNAPTISPPTTTDTISPTVNSPKYSQSKYHESIAVYLYKITSTLPLKQ